MAEKGWRWLRTDPEHPDDPSKVIRESSDLELTILAIKDVISRTTDERLLGIYKAQLVDYEERRERSLSRGL